MNLPSRSCRAATVLTLSVAFAGCSNVVDVQPETFSGTTTYYETPEQMDRALFGAYAALQTTYGSAVAGPAWPMIEMRSDNTTFELNPNNRSQTQQESIEDFTNAAENITGNNGWNTTYNAILQSNTILDRIEPVVYPTDAAKARVIGEAKFLRALHYFNLVRWFGDVPLLVHEVQSYEGAFVSVRTPADSVLRVVIADLKDAIPKLPVRSALPAAQAGRATSGAASMLLADVYMWQKNWQGAVDQLDAVTKMGYSLVTAGTPTAYDRVFDPAFKNGPESIFEIQWTDAVVGEGSGFTPRFLPLQSQRVLTFGTTDNATTGGGSWNIPTRDMVRAYETGDLRKNASIGYYVSATNRADLDVVFNDSVPYIKKYWHPYAIAGRANDNFPVYRYAETLLNLAESLNELGRTAEALPLINQVRVRAGLPALAGLSQAAFRDAVFREQRVELAFENKRWFQLVRTGRAIPIMTAHGAEIIAYSGVLRRSAGTYAVTPQKLLFPIPQREVTVNALPQNPGY